MKNSNQLKALIRNFSKENNVSAQILLRNYMHERFIERVSLSRYKNNIVFKGGQLKCSHLLSQQAEPGISIQAARFCVCLGEHCRQG